MMFAAKAELQNAEKVKQFLLHRKLLHPHYLPFKEFGFIYFPLAVKARVPRANIITTRLSFPRKEKKAEIKDLLKGKLTSQEMKLIPKSQEIVGTVMILEIPDKLKKKENYIADAYLKSNKHILTVVKKKEIHEGEFRLRKVAVLAGDNTTETIHHENGVAIKLDLEKTYFSARLAGERLRIARMVKKGETVLVMFSGAAPYPLVIAHNSPAKRIDAVELNPLAHRYAVDNVQMNNLSEKIVVYYGDVHIVVPKIQKKI